MNTGNKSGGERARVTPVPIPNTEVKPRNADDTVLETARESRWLPDFLFLCICVKCLTISAIKKRVQIGASKKLLKMELQFISKLLNRKAVVTKNRRVSIMVITSVVFASCKPKSFVSKIKLYGLNFLSFSN